MRAAVGSSLFACDMKGWSLGAGFPRAALVDNIHHSAVRRLLAVHRQLPARGIEARAMRAVLM